MSVPANKNSRKMPGMASLVLSGAFLGILTGLFFGDSAALLQPVGEAYIMLLQSAVFPYLITSLLHGLGRLHPGTARKLFARSWFILLLLWAGTYAALILLGRSLPGLPAAASIDPTAATEPSAKILQILLPANFFADVANNYVPAVIIFSLLYGVAIQRFDKKESLLSVLEVLKNASVSILTWVVKLAPIGVFALFAYNAGTLRPENLSSMLLYLLVLLFGTLFLAFYTMPAVLSSLLPASHREILGHLKQGFVLALVTSQSVAALPFVMEAAKKMAERAGAEDQQSEEILETTLALSYPLGQLGNFFVYYFLLFASFWFLHPYTATQSVLLPFVSLVSCLGSPGSTVNAVKFLSAWLSLPQETTALYVTTMVGTRYCQVLLSVIGFYFLTTLCTLSFFGKLKLRPAKLATALAVSAAVIAAFSFTLRVAGPTPFAERAEAYLDLSLPSSLTAGVEATIHRAPEGFAEGRDPRSRTETTLKTIRRTQELYVGYNSQIAPFCFFNREGELAGYDVAFAYRLARDLNVKLVFVPFDWKKLEDDLRQGRFDIAMSGLYMTAPRMNAAGVSRAYHHDSMALLVPSGQAGRFLDYHRLRDRGDLTIACFDDPVLLPMARDLFPSARVVPMKDYEEIKKHPEVDAAFWTFTELSRFAASHPGFTAVKPRNMGAFMAYAYLTPPDSPVFLRLLDQWLEMEQTDGFMAKQAAYWIEQKAVGPPEPRWSILKDLILKEPPGEE